MDCDNEIQPSTSFTIKDSQYALGQNTMTDWGAKGDWDLRISDLVKNPDGSDI